MNSNLKSLIAANWKMNILPSESLALAVALTDMEWPDSIEVVLCPGFTHLDKIKNLKLNGVFLGAQNCHHLISGAFTGEISAPMLIDLSCDFVILGHSERRMLGEEENKRVPLKISAALNAGLQVIYCCGESKDCREKNQQEQFILAQLTKDIFPLNPEQLQKISIAYEPIWAIGSGMHANPDQVRQIHRFIRKALLDCFGKDASDVVRILYGGSVNASNVESFAELKEVNGVLVGGASLIPSEFKEIIKAFF